MNKMTILLLLLLAVVIGWALWRSLRRAKRGGACCGEHETVTLTQPTDRNAAHYPYTAELTLGGMTCENCARRVANALNALDGVWATVRFDKRSARLRCKQPPEEAAIRRAVSEAGYVVMSYTAGE